MENPNQLDQENKNEQLLQPQPSQLSPTNSAVVYSSASAKHGVSLSAIRLPLKRLAPLLSTTKGIAAITVCCLLVLGGGSAAVVKLSDTAHNGSANITKIKQPSVVSANPASEHTSSSSKPTTSSSGTSGTTITSSPVKTSSSKSTTSSSGSTTTKSSSTSTSSSGGSSSGSSGSGSSGSGSGTTTPTIDGCSNNGVEAPCVGGASTGASGWGAPVFDDEFSGTTLDTSAWDTHDGWTNQNNVTDHASNITESGGNVILTVASASSGAAIETINYTLDVGDFAEAKIDFPGNGTTIYNWPAFWAAGPGWPASGEQDIFEGLGTATANYHYAVNGNNTQAGPFDIPGTWSNAFHTYGIYRGSTYCDVYYDGVLVKTYPTSDTGTGENLLVTLGASNTPAYGTASEVKVDYVRAWQ